MQNCNFINSVDYLTSERHLHQHSLVEGQIDDASTCLKVGGPSLSP